MSVTYIFACTIWFRLYEIYDLGSPLGCDWFMGFVCSSPFCVRCAVSLHTFGSWRYVTLSIVSRGFYVPFAQVLPLRTLVMLGARGLVLLSCVAACALSLSLLPLLLLWAFVGTLDLSGGLVMLCEVLPPDFSFVLTDVDGC